MLLVAATLSAQRYYGRDHHLYHPPPQAKHKTSQSANSHVHPTSTTAANSAGHGPGATGTQSATVHGSMPNSKPTAVTPPNPAERQPQ
jgi:hypothetical protein